MQQQLADPASALASSGGVGNATGGAAIAGAGAATAAATAGSTPASFTDALNSAMASSAIGTSDATDTTGVTGALTPALATASPALTSGLATTSGLGTTSGLATTPGLGSTGMATGSAGAQVQAMTNMADSLVGKPYVYGGGHGGWGPQTGYDCSGFVSAVLHAGGYLSQPADTTSLPQQAGMEPGPGQYVTVYDRAQPGQSGHVIIEINGQFYESGGSHGAWGGGGGVEKIGTPSPDYLATFPNVLHPAGL
jgi:cell wall-associated NlpC family hydrolase